MKLKLILILSLVGGMILTGCSNSGNKLQDSTFDKAMSEGKLAIANQEYAKAEAMFNLAIQENKDDKEAKALYEQTLKMIDAQNLLENGDLENAELTLQELNSIDSNLDSLKKVANKLLEDINAQNNKSIEKSESNLNKDNKSEEIEEIKEVQEVKQDKYLLEFNNIIKNEDISDLVGVCINEQLDDGPEINVPYLKTVANICSELKDKFYKLAEIAPDELYYNVDRVYVYLCHAEISLLDAYNSQSIEDMYSDLELAYGALNDFQQYLNDLQACTNEYYNQ